MKKYFQFIGFRKDIIYFISIMILAAIFQCYNHWAVGEIIKTDFMLIATFTVASLLSDWFEMKSDNTTSSNGIKKYFQFTALKRNFTPSMVAIMIFITGQLHGNWAIPQMIKSDFIIIIAWIVGSFIADLLQIKNDNAKNKTLQE